MEQLPHLSEQDEVDRYLRNYNDTATWLAETLDGSMLTSFEYSFDGRELYASDGSPLSDIFLDALNDANRLVSAQPELAFEVRRRKLELAEYGDMIRMARGELPNTMIVVSDFPPELMHATKDVGGYNATRKQTMLRVLSWNGQKLKIHSQSLDGSDRRALEKIYSHFGRVPEQGELLGQRVYSQIEPEEQQYMTTRLTGIYDRSMAEQYGGEWYAGRNERRTDTYQFVLSEHQLLDHFANKYMHRSPTDEDRYNIAALMQERFTRFRSGGPMEVTESQVAVSAIGANDVEWRLQQAGNRARAEGKVFSGCGISVANQAAELELHAAGYGNRSVAAEEDRLGSRIFTCSNGHTNYRVTPNKLEPYCKACGIEVGCAPPKKPRKSSYERMLAGYKRKRAMAAKVGNKVLAGSVSA